MGGAVGNFNVYVPVLTRSETISKMAASCKNDVVAENIASIFEIFGVGDTTKKAPLESRCTSGDNLELSLSSSSDEETADDRQSASEGQTTAPCSKVESCLPSTLIKAEPTDVDVVPVDGTAGLAGKLYILQLIILVGQRKMFFQIW